MENNKKVGITLITMIITIVVMLIIISTAIISVRNIINDTKKKDFAREIYLISNQVKIYKVRNDKLPVKSNVEVSIDEIKFESRNVFNEESGFSKGNILLKELDLIELGITDARLGNKKDGDKDIYLVSEETNKIYYLKGEKIGKNTYYALDNELKNQIGLN